MYDKKIHSEMLCRIICAILVEGIMGSICMKVFQILATSSGEDVFSYCDHFLQWTRIIYAILVVGIKGNICVKLF